MPFMKYATMPVVAQERVSLDQWGAIRKSAGQDAGFVVDTRALRMGSFSPDNFLMTHATIIASVDVESNGYHITPETTRYVNANNDAWERGLLRKVYQTFVGAENYLEHIQIPTLSKGKILDAVIRNLGDTDYVDILVATNRKHADLIEKIEAGVLNGMSMGCIVGYTFCSRCGHKAADEVELCPHIRYGKGDEFIDADGIKRKTAELCGHVDDPDSNMFIEASWVEAPAFSGAVVRNLVPTLDQQQFAAVMEKAGAKEIPIEGLGKAASIVVPGLAEAVSTVKEARRLIHEIEDWPGMTFPLKKPGPTLKNEKMPVVKGPRDIDDRTPNRDTNLWEGSKLASAAVDNTSMLPEAKEFYREVITTASNEGWESLSGQISQRKFLTAVVLSDKALGHKGLTAKLAKVLEAAGPTKLYSSKETFLDRCAGVLGRRLVQAERDLLLKYGQLLGWFDVRKNRKV